MSIFVASHSSGPCFLIIENKNMNSKSIIRFFGGFTKEDVTIIKMEAISDFLKLLFRKGDQVYIKDNNYNPFKKYFLLESYNGGNCWYVSEKADDKRRDVMGNGVSTKDLSQEPLPRCPSCNQVLNNTQALNQPQ